MRGFIRGASCDDGDHRENDEVEKRVPRVILSLLCASLTLETGILRFLCSESV